MNRERLTRLITVLAAVPADHFDILNWKVEHRCGTVACALGYSGSDPQFVAEGFTLLPEMSNQPCFDGFIGYMAGARFFDITPAESEYLFNPDEYEGAFSDVEDVTPTDVIRRIAELLARP